MDNIDVLVVGELNVDLILNQIESFPEIGKEKIAGEMSITLGSSSAIFASNLSSLGAKVSFIGKIGKDQFGDVVLRSLKSKGVDTTSIQQSDTLNTGATIVLNFNEDRAMVTHPGAMENLSLKDIRTEEFSKAQHLHFSSYFLQPGIQKDILTLFKLAKDAGLTTSFDAQWDPGEKWDIDLRGLLPYVDVFLPNEKEIRLLTGKKIIEEAIDSIKDQANIIVVKMGNKGSMCWYKGQTLLKEPFLNKNVVDAIGAGDSFNAGFIYKFIQKASLETCQTFGNLTGAISTTQPGGTTAFTNYTGIMNIAKETFGYVE
jgi:sugar/nucleoside kinase (ribokinase family)